MTEIFAISISTRRYAITLFINTIMINAIVQSFVQTGLCSFIVFSLTIGDMFILVLFLGFAQLMLVFLHNK